MGKFVKKGKITADLGVMDDSQPVLGVRTRARTLALQQSPESGYIQLRNRRLVKARLPPLSPSRKQDRKRQGSRKRVRSGNQRIQGRRTGSRLRVESVSPVAAGPDSISCSMVGEVEVELEMEEARAETSFGENDMELDGNGRTTRESTPSSFTRDLRPIITPRSAVGPAYSGPANLRREQDSVQTSMPSAREIDDLFADLGKQQQKSEKEFMEKYNFDVMNDSPLRGRFEWAIPNSDADSNQ